jgi:hypothetical protein
MSGDASIPGVLIESTRDRLLSRKFLLAVGVVLSATALVAFDKIADGVYSAVVIAVVAAYITGNVAQAKGVKQ